MKIALYIEDGLEQIVLTPETETEKGIVGKLHDQQRELSICRGTFYACRGGWTRQRDIGPINWGPHSANKDDDSTIIVLRPTPPSVPEPESQPEPETGNPEGC